MTDQDSKDSLEFCCEGGGEGGGGGDYIDVFPHASPKTPKPDPELDNFLSRVDEISEIINNLASGDNEVNERGLRQAELLLHSTQLPKGEDAEAEEVSCKVIADRTLINPGKGEEEAGGDGMGPQAFMKMMEADVAEREANYKERKSRSDKLRKEGNIAFSRKDFAAALKGYNKAIELIKDSPCLYCNRALTYLRLALYSSAIEDCGKALRLEEYSLRARMFLAKAYFLQGKGEECRRELEAAREILPGSVALIDKYEEDLFRMEEGGKKPFDYDFEQERKWQAAARYEGTEHPVAPPPRPQPPQN